MWHVAGGVHGRGACMVGGAWLGVGGMHGWGAYVTGGVCGNGVCMAGGECVWLRGQVWLGGMCGRGALACMAGGHGGHVWQGSAWWGACMAGVHATEDTTGYGQ